MRIPLQEITVNPSSYIDSAGRVFSWQGRIFRGIAPDQVGHFKALLQSDVLKRLEQQGMIVESWIPTEQFEEFDFVIEHRRIPYVSYCVEWTPSMLKDAALLTLRIAQELSEHDLTLQDAYPWNILFEGARPVLVDFGSIMPVRHDALWAPYDQFCNFFLFPLYLYSAGLYEIAHRSLFDYLGGLSHAQFFDAVPFSVKRSHPLRYGKLAASYHLANLVSRFNLEDRLRGAIKQAASRVVSRRSRKKFFESLIDEIERIRMPGRRSFWARYYERGACSYAEPQLESKEKIVREVLAKYQPATVLDIGCNTGLFSQIAATKAKVVAFDSDVQSVEQLYLNAKKAREDITPLVMDVLNPTPSFGWCGKQFPVAQDRIKAEMVFAFALIHHLAITGRQGFRRVLDALDEFSNRFVLLEWVSPEDPKVKKLMANSRRDYSWYSFGELKQILEARYRNTVFYPPHTPTRQFILYGTNSKAN